MAQGLLLDPAADLIDRPPKRYGHWKAGRFQPDVPVKSDAVVYE